MQKVDDSIVIVGYTARRISHIAWNGYIAARPTGGNLWMWGLNSIGQLGLGTVVTLYTRPGTPVGGNGCCCRSFPSWYSLLVGCKKLHHFPVYCSPFAFLGGNSTSITNIQCPMIPHTVIYSWKTGNYSMNTHTVRSNYHCFKDTDTVHESLWDMGNYSMNIYTVQCTTILPLFEEHRHCSRLQNVTESFRKHVVFGAEYGGSSKLRSPLPPFLPPFGKQFPPRSSTGGGM